MMKVLVDSITLDISGKEMTFSEKELKKILEEYYARTSDIEQEMAEYTRMYKEIAAREDREIDGAIYTLNKLKKR